MAPGSRVRGWVHQSNLSQIHLANDPVADPVTLEPGWNLVTPPVYTDAENAFGDVDDAVLVLD